MDNLNINSKILYTNAKNFGIDLVSLYKVSSKTISEKIVNKFGKDKEYGVICGLAGNGGDGLALAKSLSAMQVKVKLYLIGRAKNIEDPVAVDLWEELKKTNVEIKQDCYAESIGTSDVLVECLVGTGLVGNKLNKRFLDVIKRISHLKRPIVAMDIPAPGYVSDLTLSLLYPKTKQAEVISIELPKQLTLYPGPGEVEVLFKPKKHSYKVKNGKLLFISNSTDTSALNSILKYSEDYLVQVYIYCLKDIEEKENTTLVKEEDLEEIISQVDVIFLDKFEKNSVLNRGLISEILKLGGNKYVLSESALDYIKTDQLKSITDKLFILDKVSGGERGFQRTAVELKANLIVPSIQSYLYSSEGELRLDITGKLFNKSLQLELLCLTAVLSTKNDTWLSLRASDFLLVRI